MRLAEWIRGMSSCDCIGLATRIHSKGFGFVLGFDLSV